MSAERPLGRCCTQGARHEGSATGKVVKLAGLDAYVSGDPSHAKDKTLVIAADVLGYSFINVQLLADSYASHGYYVVVPDLFHNDPAPLNPPASYNLLKEWFPNHPFEKTVPLFQKVLDTLKSEQKPRYMVGIGYCYGAHVIAPFLGSNGPLHAGAFNHPSFVDQKDITNLKRPLLINGAAVDDIYTDEVRKWTEDELRRVGATFKTVMHSQVQHGFTLRADLSDPQQKWAKEDAFTATVDWFARFSQ